MSEEVRANDYIKGLHDGKEIGYQQGREDREKEVLHYLVVNGYIKYGFDEVYLAEKLTEVSKERKNEFR